MNIVIKNTDRAFQGCGQGTGDNDYNPASYSIYDADDPEVKIGGIRGTASNRRNPIIWTVWMATATGTMNVKKIAGVCQEENLTTFHSHATHISLADAKAAAKAFCAPLAFGIEVSF